MLRAAHVDVCKMNQLLIQVYQYEPADIQILIDDGIDGHRQPTRANILLAIEELVKDVKDGDSLVFHYSGHSTQVAANSRSNSEEDGMDECIVPLDGEERKIIDNELYNALVKPLHHISAHLVAILDTCHSGSLLDLPHYWCNRLYMPWMDRGKRMSEELWHGVARRGARFSSLIGGYPCSTVTPTPTHHPTRRSAVSIVCDPPVTASAAPSPRSACRPIPRRHSYRVDEEVAGVDVQPTFAKEWLLEDELRRCESPVGRFPCNGWCRSRPDIEAPVLDVISLASCQDSQSAWEEDDGQTSMTSLFVDLLRENPNRSIKEVLERVSHATYEMAMERHRRSKLQKTKRKHYIRNIKCRIGGLERAQRSTASLAPRASEPRKLAAAPTFPHPRTQSVLVARLVEFIAVLKQKLRDPRLRGGYDMDAVQNPELSSHRPLDMGRMWRM